MRKDKFYKALCNDLKNHLDIQSIKTNIIHHKPDALLLYKNIHYIIEHSSTGDRKSHLGELLQAYVYTKLNNSKTVFILILDNQSINGPKKKSEQERLLYYFSLLNTDKVNLSILVLSSDEINTIELLKNVISNTQI